MATLKLNNTTILTENNGLVNFPSGTLGTQVRFPEHHIVQIVQATQPLSYTQSTVTAWTSLSDWLQVVITTKFNNSKILLNTHFHQRASGNTTVGFRWIRYVTSEVEIANGSGYSTDWDNSFASASTNNLYWPFTVSHEYLDTPNVPAGTTITYYLKYRHHSGTRTVELNGSAEGVTSATDRARGLAVMVAKEVMS